MEVIPMSTLVFQYLDTYVDEILDDARRHCPGGLVEHQLQHALHLVVRHREEKLHRLVHAPDLEEPLLHVLILHAHSGAAQHYPLHPLQELRRQRIGHESTVADPRNTHPSRNMEKEEVETRD